MPADRFLHPKCGHSEKVRQLTDLEYRVWTQYLLSADDYGVMRLSAVTVQADNDALDSRPAKMIQKCLERLVSLGLILTFHHQDRFYCCQADWQEFQKIRYPRSTIEPTPPADVLAKCSRNTCALFLLKPGEVPATLPENSGKVSETFPTPARAGGREEAHGLRQAANGNGSRPTASRAITGSGVMAGALPRDHMRHAHCGRVCVPEFIHAEFLPKLSGDADARLKAFYVSTLAAIPEDQDIGDEPPKFWRAHFARAFGSVAPIGHKMLTVEELLAND